MIIANQCVVHVAIYSFSSVDISESRDMLFKNTENYLVLGGTIYYA